MVVGGGGVWGGVCTVIFMSNPATVLRLCCVVVVLWLCYVVVVLCCGWGCDNKIVIRVTVSLISISCKLLCWGMAI